MASAADHNPDPRSPPSLSSHDPSSAAPSAVVASRGGDAPESVPPAEAEGASAASAGESAAEVEEEEEEAECGFCLFMKGGGCKDAFVAWEKCVEDSERFGADVVEKCFDATSVLKKCMDAHADYYAPILQAEQAMAVAVAEEATDSAAADDDGPPKDEDSISQSETKIEEKES